jgi:hypothetical protein
MKHVRNTWAYAVMAAILIVSLAVLVVPGATAQEPGSYPMGRAPALRHAVIPPDSVVFGKTYGEWSAAWEQWVDSVPVATHPLFDNGDCSVGQSGPVWFLGGKFCSIYETNCGTANVVRTCSVPAGKALYVAVLNSEYSALEMGDPKIQIAQLRSLSASGMDGAADLAFEIDGVSVPHLAQDFRVQSPAFVFTLPDDNLFTAIGEGQFAGGAYFPGVDDGVYVMLDSPTPGRHVVHFHGELPLYGFTLDVTYLLNVAVN